MPRQGDGRSEVDGLQFLKVLVTLNCWGQPDVTRNLGLKIIVCVCTRTNRTQTACPWYSSHRLAQETLLERTVFVSNLKQTHSLCVCVCVCLSATWCVRVTVRTGNCCVLNKVKKGRWRTSRRGEEGERASGDVSHVSKRVLFWREWDLASLPSFYQFFVKPTTSTHSFPMTFKQAESFVVVTFVLHLCLTNQRVWEHISLTFWSQNRSPLSVMKDWAARLTSGLWPQRKMSGRALPYFWDRLLEHRLWMWWLLLCSLSLTHNTHTTNTLTIHTHTHHTLAHTHHTIYTHTFRNVISSTTCWTNYSEWMDSHAHLISFTNKSHVLYLDRHFQHVYF